MKDTQTKFAVTHGFITTAAVDGRVTINARTVARIEEPNDALLATLVARANLTVDLADALDEIVRHLTDEGMRHIFGLSLERAQTVLAKARES